MKRKQILIAGMIFVAALFGWAFLIERNPPIEYDPIDGKSMAESYESQLLLAEGLSNYSIFLPSNETDQRGTRQMNLASDTILALQVVRYRRPQVPVIFWKIAKAIRGDLKGAALDQVGIRFDVDDFQVFSTRRDYFDEALLEPYGKTLSKKEVTGMVNNLGKLEPNGPLRLHSHFILVLAKNDIRVYPISELPENIKPLYELVRTRIETLPRLNHHR
ncbi:MAG: hypothetical protein WCI55_15800 [Armatimonadota bacterium]